MVFVVGVKFYENIVLFDFDVGEMVCVCIVCGSVSVLVLVFVINVYML